MQKKRVKPMIFVIGHLPFFISHFNDIDELIDYDTWAPPRIVTEVIVGSVQTWLTLCNRCVLCASCGE